MQQDRGEEASGLEVREFGSRSEIDEHVTKNNYASSALCFALAWEEYDTSDAEKPSYSLEILTAYEQANMLNPNYPQDRYYTQLYNE